MQDQKQPDPQQLKDQWHWNFTNHTPSPDGIKKIEALRSAAMALSDAYIDLTPHSRERSLALTHLESSLQSAVAAIARNETADTQSNTQGAGTTDTANSQDTQTGADQGATGDGQQTQGNAAV